MEFYENFRPRCEIDEAVKQNEFIIMDINLTAYECYNKAYVKSLFDEPGMKAINALGAVYALGFLSGSRAVRERRKKSK